MSTYKTRWMIRRDIAQVQAIDKHSYHLPWEEDDFLARLRHRNCIGVVAEWHDQIIGYMVYDLYPSHIQLTRLATHPNMRLRGVGRGMTRYLCDKLDSNRRRIAVEFSEVGLETAAPFFGRCGFNATGTKLDPMGYGHVVVMEYNVTEASDDDLPPILFGLFGPGTKKAA